MFGPNFANQMTDSMLRMNMHSRISTYESLVKSGDISQERCDELTLKAKGDYVDTRIKFEDSAIKASKNKGDSNEGNL